MSPNKHWITAMLSSLHHKASKKRSYTLLANMMLVKWPKDLSEQRKWKALSQCEEDKTGNNVNVLNLTYVSVILTRKRSALTTTRVLILSAKAWMSASAAAYMSCSMVVG